MKKLTFITSNPNKATQLSKYLSIELQHQTLELDEIQSLNLEVILQHKAKQAFAKVNSPVIVDDTSVVIKSFGKLPGPFIKWFLKELGPEKICNMVKSFKDRSAIAEVGVAFYDCKQLLIFKGKIVGEISDKPKGDRGFGWDFIFIPKGYNKTRGQMSQSDYDQTSPRRMALKKLEKFLGKSGTMKLLVTSCSRD